MADAVKTQPEAVEQPKEGQAPAPMEKKEKPPKAPKPQKEKAPKQKKQKKAKGEKGGFPKILLLLAALTALLIVAGVVYYFDLFAARSNVLYAANQALASLDPTYRHYSEILTERENALSAKEQALQQWEDTLTKDDDRLQKRAADLNAREKRLNDQQLSTTPLFRQEISEEKLAELKNLGKIYSGMETEAAVKALSQLSGPMEIAEVLFYMDKNAAADVLAAFNPELTAQITREMLRE